MMCIMLLILSIGKLHGSIASSPSYTRKQVQVRRLMMSKNNVLAVALAFFCPIALGSGEISRLTVSTNAPLQEKQDYIMETVRDIQERQRTIQMLPRPSICCGGREIDEALAKIRELQKILDDKEKTAYRPKSSSNKKHHIGGDSRLNLANCKLVSLWDFGALDISTSFDNIREIDLSHNALIYLPLKQILELCPALQALNVSHNALRTVLHMPMEPHGALESLDLSGNKFTEFNLSAQYRATPHLIFLDLSRNRDLRTVEYLAGIKYTPKKGQEWPVINLSGTALNENTIKGIKSLYVSNVIKVKAKLETFTSGSKCAFSIASLLGAMIIAGASTPYFGNSSIIPLITGPTVGFTYAAYQMMQQRIVLKRMTASTLVAIAAAETNIIT
jgi:hypothetical protein